MSFTKTEAYRFGFLVQFYRIDLERIIGIFLYLYSDSLSFFSHFPPNLLPGFKIFFFNVLTF